MVAALRQLRTTMDGTGTSLGMALMGLANAIWKAPEDGSAPAAPRHLFELTGHFRRAFQDARAACVIDRDKDSVAHMESRALKGWPDAGAWPLPDTSPT